MRACVLATTSALLLAACGGGAKPVPPPAPSTVGNKCALDADCGAAMICATEPGGNYCTRDCTAAGAACPQGSVCAAVSGTAKRCLKSCGANPDCRAEQVCFSSAGGSVCLPKCAADADCASAHCDSASGLCQASRVGNPCGADADCGSQPAFCNTVAAGGYCSLPCGGNTAATSTCPGGSNCVSIGGGGAACLKACAQAADCRQGQLCADTGAGVLSCVPACATDLNCGATLRCDVASGACVPSGPPAGALGGACASNADCAAGAFCATGYPGGYCSFQCASNPGACGAAATCVNFGGSSSCLSNCATRRDCRAGYACYPLGGNAGAVCTPACKSAGDCGAGQGCDASSGLCVSTATGDATVESIDLTPSGAIPVHTSTLSDPLTVTVPAGAISVTFVGQAIADTTARVVVYRIESPDGRIYDFSGTSNVMKVLPPSGPGAFAVLAPNSPSVPFTPGAWTIKLLATKETTASVKALIKRNPQSPLASGKIDLNLFFAGMPGISAATAPGDANFKQLFDLVKAIWAPAGIAIGNVTYNDVTGANLARFQDLQETDLGALMQLSLTPNATDDALNVFFVRSITSGSSLNGYIILGESAGIPGVPLRGTSGSGLAVTSADFPRGLADIADTWAHEGSHWLGLFHTTESAGTAFDPLPDTAECHASTSDTDKDGVMQPQECVNFDANNLMFWTSVPSIPNSNLTANQQFVLLRNPAVH